MAIIIIVFVLLFAASLFADCGRKSAIADEYSRLENWDEKMTRINHCC